MTFNRLLLYNLNSKEFKYKEMKKGKRQNMLDGETTGQAGVAKF